LEQCKIEKNVWEQFKKMYSPDVRITICDPADISTIPDRDPWKILQPLWKRMQENTFLSGMGCVNKYLLYALSVHILSVDERLRKLENQVFS
jgi:hypothetical protein